MLIAILAIAAMLFSLEAIVNANANARSRKTRRYDDEL